MRINTENSTYGAGLAYVIHNGIVRDIVQQEAEWGTGGSGVGGADNCPNVYANIVLTLPANATYYTYQLRLMFINSTQPRTITDLCPIELTTSLSSLQLQTENGTVKRLSNSCKRHWNILQLFKRQLDGASLEPIHLRHKGRRNNVHRRRQPAALCL